MKYKSSQVSLFTLISFTILIAGAFLFLSNNIKTSKLYASTNSYDIGKFKYYFEECVKITTYKGVREIGRYGGFSYIREPYFYTETFKANYAVYNNTITLPLLNETEIYLSNYLKASIPVCANFTLFKEFEFEDNGIKVNSTFNNESVIVIVDWNLILHAISPNINTYFRVPLTVKKYPIRFISAYKTAESVAIKSRLDQNYVDDIFLLNQFSNITYSVYDNNTVVYIITDNQVIDDGPYYFIFAARNG